MIYRLGLIVIGLLLTACGAEEEIEGTFLEGTWLESVCSDYNDEETEFGHVIFSFRGSNVEVINRTYDNVSCEGNPIFEAKFNGKFQLGDEVILGSGETVTQYLITLNKAIATPLTEEVSQELNTKTFCGFSDWSVGLAKSVYECRFSGVGNNEIKDIALVEGNELFMGDSYYKSEDGYSTVLDTSTPFIKQ